jgi:hypothetical protein
MQVLYTDMAWMRRDVYMVAFVLNSIGVPDGDPRVDEVSIDVVGLFEELASRFVVPGQEVVYADHVIGHGMVRVVLSQQITEVIQVLEILRLQKAHAVYGQVLQFQRVSLEHSAFNY